MGVRHSVLQNTDEIANREGGRSEEVGYVIDFLRKTTDPAMKFECDEMDEALRLYKKLRRFFQERWQSARVMMRGRTIYVVRNGVEI